MMGAPLRLGVLVSGSGTNLQAILDAVAARRLDAEVRLVLSNRSGAGALERAARAGAPVLVVSHRRAVLSRADWILVLKEGRVEAEKWLADLLVVGTHGRKGINHLLMGSVAEGVMRTANMPVLLVRGT